MATYQNISLSDVIRGSYWDGLTITLYSSESPQVPIDLTGCVITYQIKLNGTIAAYAAQWTTDDNTITITGADNNELNIIGRNMNIPVGSYVGDIDILFTDGKNRTWFRTTQNIIQDVTR